MARQGWIELALTVIVALAALAFNPAPAYSSDDPIQDKLDAADKAGSRHSNSIFFMGYADCVERLQLPGADPRPYCKERFRTAAVDDKNQALQLAGAQAPNQ